MNTDRLLFLCTAAVLAFCQGVPAEEFSDLDKIMSAQRERFAGLKSFRSRSTLVTVSTRSAESPRTIEHVVDLCESSSGFYLLHSQSGDAASLRSVSAFDGELYQDLQNDFLTISKKRLPIPPFAGWRIGVFLPFAFAGNGSLEKEWIATGPNLLRRLRDESQWKQTFSGAFLVTNRNQSHEGQLVSVSFRGGVHPNFNTPMRFTVDFDRARNFLPVSWAWTSTDGGISVVYRVQEWNRIANSALGFIPKTAILEKYWEAAKPFSETRISVSSMEVNSPEHTHESFQIDPGMAKKVFDKDNKVYISIRP